MKSNSKTFQTMHQNNVIQFSLSCFKHIHVFDYFQSKYVIILILQIYRCNPFEIETVTACFPLTARNSFCINNRSHQLNTFNSISDRQLNSNSKVLFTFSLIPFQIIRDTFKFFLTLWKLGAVQANVYWQCLIESMKLTLISNLISFIA